VDSVSIIILVEMKRRPNFGSKYYDGFRRCGGASEKSNDAREVFTRERRCRFFVCEFLCDK
jgi:hypothetical protein